MTMRHRWYNRLELYLLTTIITIILLLFVAPWFSVRASSHRFSVDRSIIAMLDMTLVFAISGSLIVTWWFALRRKEVKESKIQWSLRRMFIVTAAVAFTCFVLLFAYGRLHGTWKYPDWLLHHIATWIDN